MYCPLADYKKFVSSQGRQGNVCILLLVGKLEVTSFVSEVRSSGGIINSAIVQAKAKA